MNKYRYNNFIIIVKLMNFIYSLFNYEDCNKLIEISYCDHKLESTIKENSLSPYENYIPMGDELSNCHMKLNVNLFKINFNIKLLIIFKAMNNYNEKRNTFGLNKNNLKLMIIIIISINYYQNTFNKDCYHDYY